MANTQFGGGMEKRENVVFPYLIQERKEWKKSHGPTNFGKIREKRL